MRFDLKKLFDILKQNAEDFFMALVPWRFYEDLSSFNRQMNQLFDRFFGTDFIGSPDKISYPPVRVAETQQEIIIFLKISPLFPDEISITYKDDLLVIKGEKKKSENVPDAQKENFSFTRIIEIPKKIYPEKIKAKFKAGELFIILPKVTNKNHAVKIKIE